MSGAGYSFDDSADDSTAVTESAVISREIKELRLKIDELEDIIRKAFADKLDSASGSGRSGKGKGEEGKEEKLVDDA